LLHSWIVPWYELRGREVEIGDDIKMSELSEVWNTVKHELDLEDEEIYLAMYNNAFSIEMERRDVVYVEDFKFYFYHESGEDMVIRQARYKDGELEINRAHIDSSDHDWKKVAMDQYMETMGDVDYALLMVIGDTESDKYHMFMERFLEPGKVLRASQRPAKVKHIISGDVFYLALEQGEEVLLGKEFISFVMTPIMDVIHEVGVESNGEEKIIKTPGTASFGQDLIVYVPVDDVEYVKVIEPPNVWDSDVLEKNLTWLKATGMRSIEVGPVGIISYMMPKGEYEKMIVEMYQEYTNSINSIVEEKKYEYVLEVSFNSLLSVFDIIVEGDEFNKDVRNFELLELLSDLGKRYGYMANVRKDRIEINVWDDESGELLQKDTISAD
jgi:hypothetical protein